MKIHMERVTVKLDRVLPRKRQSRTNYAGGSSMSSALSESKTRALPLFDMSKAEESKQPTKTVTPRTKALAHRADTMVPPFFEPPCQHERWLDGWQNMTNFQVLQV